MLKINIEDTEVELSQIVGSRNEKAIDISNLRNKTNYVTYDPGLGNTAITKSSITFLDGEKGILQYRGIDVFNLVAEKSFLEVAYLLFKGVFPTTKELSMMKSLIFAHSHIDKSIQRFFQNFSYLPTMNLLSIGVTLFKEPTELDDFEQFCFYLAKYKVLCSYLFEPHHSRISFSEDYCEDFAYLSLNKKDPAITKILNALLITHADHEQNCSTTSLRVIASSKATIKNALSGAILALSGPLHGGANEEVISMLQMITNDRADVTKYIQKAKDKEDNFLLMGFGHRVYKNFDPRATIIKELSHEFFEKNNIVDPLLQTALMLEKAALKDPYFISKHLYPNVDFYSGILYKALNIPSHNFTPMFSLGRMSGWLTHYFEFKTSPEFKIIRPRQIFV